MRRTGINSLHSQRCKPCEVECMPLVFCATNFSRGILTWLDILNSNQRRTWGTKMENWSTPRGTSISSCYLEEEEEKVTSSPNLVKDDLYVRRLSPIMPSPGSCDQFLPKCWTPEEVSWKRIKRETYKPWYKEFQGFRFVPVHVSVLQWSLFPPTWHILCIFYDGWRGLIYPPIGKKIVYI